MDKKEIIKEIPSQSYVLIQCIMFFLNYGLKYEMPSWVVWFPTIIYGSILIIILIIFLIILIASAMIS